MANTSISGLVSGLDTASIISQLMQIEAQPQTVLRTRVNAQQAQVTALQAVNTKLAGIAAKAADLAKSTSWSPVTATSSNAKVAVTAGGSALPATLTLTVGKVATASTLDLGAHALTDKVLSDGSTQVAFTKTDGTTVSVETGDGTVQGLVNAINSGAYGASATLVQVATGSYRVQITATDTGNKTMSVAPPVGSIAALTVSNGLTPGQQAEITVGTDLIKQDSNTFKDLMPGVDVTLSAGADTPAGTVTTITVARDAKSLSDSVKAMVDAVNSVLSDIDTQTAYNPSTKKSGTLAGDSLLRGVRDQLASAVTSGQNNVSFADVGIQVDRYGKVVFDEAKFQAAYAANPTATAAKFTDGTPAGLASTIAKVTNTASSSTDGTLTMAITGRNSSIRRMNDDISDWDVRLDIKRKALQRQYGALEVALGKLQSQSSWLAGQISSLPKMMGS
jgi:flagellar hook-associated protein 2